MMLENPACCSLQWSQWEWALLIEVSKTKMWGMSPIPTTYILKWLLWNSQIGDFLFLLLIKAWLTWLKAIAFWIRLHIHLKTDVDSLCGFFFPFSYSDVLLYDRACNFNTFWKVKFQVPWYSLFRDGSTMVVGKATFNPFSSDTWCCDKFFWQKS